MGVGATQLIIEERKKGGKFRSFGDFVYRCAPFLNKRMLEGLICAGAFDCFGANRAQMLLVYESVLERANKIAKQQASRQMSLFGDIIEEDNTVVEFPNVPEMESGSGSRVKRMCSACM